MRRPLGILLILAYLGGAFYFAALQSTPSRPPILPWLEKLDAEIPPDARILLAVPHDRLTLDHYRVQTRLHPRAVYPLPPKVKSVGEASDWIALKKLTWIISIEEPYARKVSDRP